MGHFTFWWGNQGLISIKQGAGQMSWTFINRYRSATGSLPCLWKRSTRHSPATWKMYRTFCKSTWQMSFDRHGYQPLGNCAGRGPNWNPAYAWLFLKSLLYITFFFYRKFLTALVTPWTWQPVSASMEVLLQIGVISHNLAVATRYIFYRSKWYSVLPFKSYFIFLC